MQEYTKILEHNHLQKSHIAALTSNGGQAMSEEQLEDLLDDGYQVFTEQGLNTFALNLQKACTLNPDDVEDILEKARKDVSKLQKKVITDKHGRRRTVYVKQAEAGTYSDKHYDHDDAEYHRGQKVKVQHEGAEHEGEVRRSVGKDKYRVVVNGKKVNLHSSKLTGDKRTMDTNKEEVPTKGKLDGLEIKRQVDDISKKIAKLDKKNEAGTISPQEKKELSRFQEYIDDLTSKEEYKEEWAKDQKEKVSKIKPIDLDALGLGDLGKDKGKGGDGKK